MARFIVRDGIANEAADQKMIYEQRCKVFRSLGRLLWQLPSLRCCRCDDYEPTRAYRGRESRTLLCAERRDDDSEPIVHFV